MVEGQRSGKTMHCTLGCRVGHDAALTGKSLDRSQINDGTTTPLLHLWNSKMAQQVNARYIDHQTAVPVFQAGFHNVAKRMEGSRIDDDVQSTEFADHFHHSVSNGGR